MEYENVKWNEWLWNVNWMSVKCEMNDCEILLTEWLWRNKWKREKSLIVALSIKR